MQNKFNIQLKNLYIFGLMAHSLGIGGLMKVITITQMLVNGEWIRFYLHFTMQQNVAWSGILQADTTRCMARFLIHKGIVMGDVKNPIPRGMVVKYTFDGRERVGIFDCINSDNTHYIVENIILDNTNSIPIKDGITPLFKAEKDGEYIPKVGDVIYNKDETLQSTVEIIKDDFIYVTKWNEGKSNELIKYSFSLFYNLFSKGEWKLNKSEVPFNKEELLKELEKIGFIVGISDKKKCKKFSELKKKDVFFNHNGRVYVVLTKTNKRIFYKEINRASEAEDRYNNWDNDDGRSDVYCVGAEYYNNNYICGDFDKVIDIDLTRRILARYGHDLSINQS